MTHTHTYTGVVTDLSHGLNAGDVFAALQTISKKGEHSLTLSGNTHTHTHTDTHTQIEGISSPTYAWTKTSLVAQW